MLENEKNNDEIDFMKTTKISLKLLKKVNTKEKAFPRIFTPRLKDRIKKESNLRSPANKTKICLLECNHDGVRTKEYFENERIYLTPQKKDEKSIEETNLKSFNIFDAIVTSKDNKSSFINLLKNSQNKINLLNPNPSKYLLSSNKVDDEALPNQSQYNKFRLDNSLYEKQEESILLFFNFDADIISKV